MTSRKRPINATITHRIDTIRPADCGEFEVPDKEADRIRRFLYGINKDGIRRYRTLREGRYLRIWRIK